VAESVFAVEVVTPEQSLVAGGASAVVLASTDGALTVLNGHTSLVSDVVPCLLRIEQPEGELLHLAVHGGFLQVDTSPGAAEGLAEGDGPLAGLSTKVTVLAGVAERAEAIDVPRAEAAKEAATALVQELSSGRGPTTDAEGAGAPDQALVEAEQSLARAELRLEVAAAHG
jgi:F0F1-type ATP synthase epsilon subunit